VPYILGILPINSGKSLSYLLINSLIISKITLIIIPLIGLKNDILYYIKEFNIPYNYYKDNLEFNNLILINIKNIIQDSFIYKVK
jgi:superfamily II DNA helicase RecQ